MSADEYPVCPHDREAFVKEDALYSYRCPECKGRVCLDCRRYGNKGFMLPLVSWMTGVCDTCYHERGKRDHVRKSYWADRERREALGKVWDEGRSAAPDAANPYAEPTHHESYVLEQHKWLRDEVQP